MSVYGNSTLLGEKRRHRSRRRRGHLGNDQISQTGPVDIRIGNKATAKKFDAFRARGVPEDAEIFRALVRDTVEMNPKDPILIVINGYREWISDILASAIDFRSYSFDYEDPNEVNKEVQLFETLQFPERSDKADKWVPWTFIIDHINLPEVYYWSFNKPMPETDEPWDLDDDISNYRLRMGCWTSAARAFLGDPNVEVVILFTRKNEVSENVVTKRLFQYMTAEPEYSDSINRRDEIGVCWMFFHLHDLITDFQNIIFEFNRRLQYAELASHNEHKHSANSRFGRVFSRAISVKLRTRDMHADFGRIWELKSYLSWHMRAFAKLSKLQKGVDKQDQDDLIWDQLDDMSDDLQQFNAQLDGLKERLDNLIELEFNIQNAEQSDNSRFLSILGTLFLPVSFLASLFGMTTVTWPVMLYLYIAIPLFLISAAFTGLFPPFVNAWDKAVYPEKKKQIAVPRNRENFTLLGDYLPGENFGAGARGKGAGMPAQKRKGGEVVKRRSGGVDLERGGRSRGRSARGRSRVSEESSDYDE